MPFFADVAASLKTSALFGVELDVISDPVFEGELPVNFGGRATSLRPPVILEVFEFFERCVFSNFIDGPAVGVGRQSEIGRQPFGAVMVRVLVVRNFYDIG